MLFVMHIPNALSSELVAAVQLARCRQGRSVTGRLGGNPLQPLRLR